MNDHCENLPNRLIVTPKLSNKLSNHSRLHRITSGMARQYAQGAGAGRGWVPGSGPIVIVWPRERIVQRCVQMLAGLPNQSIILLEQATTSDAPSFQGWATTVGAFNTESGENEAPDDEWTAALGSVLTQYGNELQGPPRPGLLRDELQELNYAQRDGDFIVTSAIALGYGGDLARLRQHHDAVI